MKISVIPLPQMKLPILFNHSHKQARHQMIAKLISKQLEASNFTMSDEESDKICHITQQFQVEEQQLRPSGIFRRLISDLLIGDILHTASVSVSFDQDCE